MKAQLVNHASKAEFSFDPIPYHELTGHLLKMQLITVYDSEDHTSTVYICGENNTIFSQLKIPTGVVYVLMERPA